jgi:hypothetical protein
VRKTPDGPGGVLANQTASIAADGALYLNALPEQPRTSASGAPGLARESRPERVAAGHRLPDGQPQVVPVRRVNPYMYGII